MSPCFRPSYARPPPRQLVLNLPCLPVDRPERDVVDERQKEEFRVANYSKAIFHRFATCWGLLNRHLLFKTDPILTSDGQESSGVVQNDDVADIVAQKHRHIRRAVCQFSFSEIVINITAHKSINKSIISKIHVSIAYRARARTCSPCLTFASVPR